LIFFFPLKVFFLTGSNWSHSPLTPNQSC